MEVNVETANSQGASDESRSQPPIPAPQHTTGHRVSPQSSAESCPTCGTGPAGRPPSYVYALGRIEPRFPSHAVEREYAQAAARYSMSGLTDRQALHSVLSRRENRYLIRQMCWVFTVQGVETYIVAPRDPMDYDALVASLRPAPTPLDLDVLVGVRGPIASPQMCNGLMLPIVGFDQVYSFDREALLKAIPKPENIDQEAFEKAAGEVLDRIIQIADNAGGTDEHRALNYLVVRYPAIYAATADAYARNRSLSSVDVRPSSLMGPQKIMEVVFSYRDRQTDVIDSLFARVVVSEMFPYLLTKLSPYYVH